MSEQEMRFIRSARKWFVFRGDRLVRIMPVIQGGADGAGTGGEGGEGGGTEGQGEGGTKPEEDLGEAGKKALDSERAARKEAEKAAKAAQKERDDFKTRLEKLESDSKSDQEKALEQVRKDAETNARKEERERSNRRILRAEVKAAAGGKLHDPEDAVRHLDLDEFEVSEDGDVDSEAISKAIEELLKEKPYLSATGTKPNGSADGGARKQGSGEVNPGIDRMRAAYAASSKT